MDSEISSSELLDIVSRLQTGLKVPKALLSTAKLLRDAPSNKPLPNRQAGANVLLDLSSRKLHVERTGKDDCAIRTVSHWNTARRKSRKRVTSLRTLRRRYPRDFSMAPGTRMSSRDNDPISSITMISHGNI